MADDIEKMEAQIKQLQDKVRAKKKAESDAKKMVIGSAIEKAVKTKKVSWSEIKNIIDEHVKSKRDRALLGLDTKEEKQVNNHSATNRQNDTSNLF